MYSKWSVPDKAWEHADSEDIAQDYDMLNEEWTVGFVGFVSHHSAMQWISIGESTFGGITLVLLLVYYIILCYA